MLIISVPVQIWVGLFGLIAAIASFRSGWKATALPSQSSSDSTDLSEPSGAAAGYDVST